MYLHSGFHRAVRLANDAPEDVTALRAALDVLDTRDANPQIQKLHAELRYLLGRASDDARQFDRSEQLYRGLRIETLADARSILDATPEYMHEDVVATHRTA
jgi:hypothetical protein